MYGAELVFESAFGVADQSTGKPLTPRHRLRFARPDDRGAYRSTLRVVDGGERDRRPGSKANSAGYAVFAKTGCDGARFFAQLSPDHKQSILTPSSRRAMIQRRARDHCNTLEAHYGLALMSNGPGPLEGFGHTGGFQGFVSRTAHFPNQGFTVSVLTNTQDGFAYDWIDGIINILTAFQRYGAPSKRLADWDGRWWSMWGASDLVAAGDVLCQVSPALTKPFDAATRSNFG
jgi:hypothetical protein